MLLLRATFRCLFFEIHCCCCVLPLGVCFLSFIIVLLFHFSTHFKFLFCFHVLKKIVVVMCCYFFIVVACCAHVFSLSEMCYSYCCMLFLGISNCGTISHASFRYALKLHLLLPFGMQFKLHLYRVLNNSIVIVGFDSTYPVELLFLL